MSDTLAEIVIATRERVALVKHAWGENAIETEARHAGVARGFAAVLDAKRREGRPALIAEIKRASPSRGVIRADFDVPTLARAYDDGGATCLSVLTEPRWFEGASEYVAAARAAVDLPVLRKDFIVDPWQITESRALGTDCVLLIVAALSDDELPALARQAFAWNMDVLVEAHDEAEVERAVAVEGALIGINNRDLRTLVVDPMRALALARRVPPGRTIVAESGLKTAADLARYMAEGIGCFLVGEALMGEANVAAATRALLA